MTVCLECGLPGTHDRQAEPWFPRGWCDACSLAQRRRAWRSYNAARRDASLLPADSCQGCGRSDRKLVGHHTDYLKPLQVDWLCSTCHGRAHREARKT